MKQVVFKLIDRLGDSKTYQVDLFEEEFFEDPNYRTIEDFKHTFKIYSPFANKSKIIKVENGLNERYFTWWNTLGIGSFDYFIDINQSFLIEAQIDHYKAIYDRDLENFIREFFLKSNLIVDRFEVISFGQANFKAYSIDLNNNAQYILFGPKIKVYENLKLLLLKIEEAIPVAFIKTISKLTTDLITYQI